MRRGSVVDLAHVAEPFLEKERNGYALARHHHDASHRLDTQERAWPLRTVTAAPIGGDAAAEVRMEGVLAEVRQQAQLGGQASPTWPQTFPALVLDRERRPQIEMPGRYNGADLAL